MRVFAPESELRQRRVRPALTRTGLAGRAARDAIPRQGGIPLDPAIRDRMQSRFRHDFGSVRVHVDAAAARAAASHNADAIAVGRDIHFGVPYVPPTPAGAALLAHELTHVVQADRAADPARPSSTVGVLEREARQVAAAVRSGVAMPPVRGAARGLRAPLRQVSGDEPTPERAAGESEAHEGPTFGNLPEDAPSPSGSRRVQLTERDGKWVETASGRTPATRTARGNYDFVVLSGSKSLWAVKSSSTDLGHTEAALGQRVLWPGVISFSNKGGLKHWTNASGHYVPSPGVPGAAGDEFAFARNAGLPMDKFVQTHRGSVTRDTGRREGPQLPVFQPKKGDVLDPPRGEIRRAGSIQRVPSGPIVHGEIVTPSTPRGEVTRAGSIQRVPSGPIVHGEIVTPSTPADRPRGGGGGRAVGVAAAGAEVVLSGIVTFVINPWLQEHFAKERAEGVREFTDQALAEANPRFAAAIQADRAKILAAQASGKRVSLHVVVEVGHADSTDNDPLIGSGVSSGSWAYVANVVQVQVVVEGEQPRPYDADTWLVGDLFRSLVGVSFSYASYDYPIEAPK